MFKLSSENINFSGVKGGGLANFLSDIKSSRSYILS